jgi:hypothetical protein
MRSSGAWNFSTYCTLWKEPSKFGFFMRRPLRVYKFQNSEYIILFLDPNYGTKVSRKPHLGQDSKIFPRGVIFLNFWVCRTSSWPKRLREPKFLISRSYGLDCRCGTNFCQQQRRRRRLTDGFFPSKFVFWV